MTESLTDSSVKIEHLHRERATECRGQTRNGSVNKEHMIVFQFSPNGMTKLRLRRNLLCDVELLLKSQQQFAFHAVYLNLSVSVPFNQHRSTD